MTLSAYKRSYRQILAVPRWQPVDVFARWGDALRQLGRSADTRRIYLSSVDRWLAWPADPLNPSQQAIHGWTRERAQALSKSTFNLELTAVRAFYRWLHANGYSESDVSLRLPKTRRVPRRLPRYLDVAQVAQLLAAPDLATWIGFRDHVMLRLLYETGIRAGELVRLTRGDVMTSERVLHINGRFVPISPEMNTLLNEWDGCATPQSLARSPRCS